MIDASGIRKAFALAGKLKDPINFSIGQPDFDTPQELKCEAIKAIEAGFNKYTPTAGIDELIDKVKKSVGKETGWSNPLVMITSGVSGGLFLVFASLINPGDEVVIIDPYFVIYKQIVKMLGGICVFVDSYPDFDLPVEKIEKAITKKTKLIIVNSPCNPTSAVYGEEKLKALANIGARNGIVVLSDQIYEKFCYDIPCPSIAPFYPDTILLKGFGKAYGMTGWRLGYVVVHEKYNELMEQMNKIQQYTFVCAPTPFQKAVVSALDYDVSKYIAEYKVKRDIIYTGLKDKFELSKPAGAFYAFVKAPAGGATRFCEKAIENNVIIIPGKVFSEKDSHFRISFAVSNDKLKKGAEILCSLA